MLKRLLTVAITGAVLLCGCSGAQNGQPPATDAAQVSAAEKSIARKELNDYTWEELSRISDEIANAKDDDAAREVAKKYGLVDEDGKLSSATKQIVLDEKRALDVRLAGICHDEKADGSGKVGLTFMTVGALDLRPMNDVATVEGGWEASSLRKWLADEVPSRLDEDLRKAIVPVNKYTNNAGITDDPESVTATKESLWPFSVHEVCGEVNWDVEEFQQKRGYQDIDGLLNMEGEQYEVFAQAGVTSDTDPNGFLSLADSTGPSPWWYRSPYAFEWTQYDFTGADGFFYQVMPSGFPKSLGSPEVPAGVVVGFCI